MSQSELSPAAPHRTRRRPTARTVFFAVLLVVLLAYTKMAFDLGWTAPGGRIGPGFFPRIIGVAALAICAGALVQSLRGGVSSDEASLEDDAGEGDLGRHPLLLMLAVLACAGLVFLLVPLGAIIAGAIFMFALLALLNRGHWVTNAVLSLAIPLGLYLLFQTALNAGLPDGILPRF